MTIIHIKHRIIHDVDRMEVCDPLQALAISHLTGKRSVNQADLANLQVLGLRVVDLDQQLKEMFS